MGRLKQMPPRITTSMPPRITSTIPAPDVTRSQYRDATQHWRRWYKTARWQALRWSVLTRDLFTCRRCHKVVNATSQLVADHIVPHRGDEAMFWDAGNLQCLCKPCHDKHKQREERTA